MIVAMRRDSHKNGLWTPLELSALDWLYSPHSRALNSAPSAGVITMSVVLHSVGLVCLS